MDLFCGLGLRSQENLHLMFKAIHTTGCKHAIHSFLDYKHHLTAQISIGFLIPQVIGIILIIAFISILHFLILIESDKNRVLFGQFKQNNRDLRNTSKFIKIRIGHEKNRLIKDLNLKSAQKQTVNRQLTQHVITNKMHSQVYQIRTD